MAAPMLAVHLQKGFQRTFVSCLSKRGLQSSTALCAGQDWRIQHGFSRSDSEYGPLTDLPDWSFADGRPAPLWKGQIRRKEENKAFASRIVFLNNEMDEGMKKWSDKQEELKQKELLKQKNQLKPKGLLHNKSQKAK